jgi:hypothetical protein
MQVIPALLIVALVGGAIVFAFYLGYTAATYREREARRAAQRRITMLTTWVKQNWPDRYAAFRDGHHMGYQQGVQHGPTIHQEAEDE